VFSKRNDTEQEYITDEENQDEESSDKDDQEEENEEILDEEHKEEENTVIEDSKYAEDLREFPRYPKEFKLTESQQEEITVRRISSFQEYFTKTLKSGTNVATNQLLYHMAYHDNMLSNIVSRKDFNSLVWREEQPPKAKCNNYMTVNVSNRSATIH